MTFSSAAKLLEEGKKVCNTDENYWGNNYKYLQYIDETNIKRDLEGKQVEKTVTRKLLLKEESLGLIDYTIKQEDIVSETWEEYIEE